MSSPQIVPLPMKENADGSIGIDLSNLENPAVTLDACVQLAVGYCKGKNKELRVKVPREYFSSIAPLCQMGFNIIDPVESTDSYIVLAEAGKSCCFRCYMDAKGNHHKFQEATQSDWQSESWRCDIGNSPNSEQGKLSALQQGLESPHTNWAYASGPTSLRNGNEVAGLEGFSTGLEIPICVVQTKKRLHPAKESKLPSTRPRGPDFEDKEKGLVLQLKLEYLQDPANGGKGHKWSTSISDNMRKNGYVREPKAVRGQWDTFKKSRDALMRRFPQGAGYWDMTMDEKKAYKKDHDRHFPLTFKPEWVDTMEEIERMELKRATIRQTRRDGQEGGVSSQPLASTITGSTHFAGASSSNVNIQASVQYPKRASAQESDEGLCVNLQRPGTITSHTHDFASSSHIWRENDHREMSCMMEEQLAVQRELSVCVSKKLTESSSLDSLGFWDDVLEDFVL